MAGKTGSEELVTVLWRDTQEEVSIPRRLIVNGNKRAQQDWLIEHKEIADPNAPAPPTPVDVVVEEVKLEQEAAIGSAVESLRSQLDELQGKLDGQPLSHAELVAARQELAEYMLKAADSNAQLTQVEGRGSQIKADLNAIAEPLIDQSAEIQRRQDENETVQERVLSDLQAQSSEALSNVAAQAAEARTEAINNSVASSLAKAIPAAEKAAREVANNHWGAGTTVTTQDPSKTDLESFGTRWFGRQLVSGDSCLQTVKTGLIVWRFTGGQWLKSSELVPKTELVSQQLSIHDESSPVTVVLGSSTKGGGGSGGAQRFALRTLNSGIAGTLVDSSAWSAAGAQIHAAEILLRVTNGVGSAFLAATLNMNADGRTWEYTEFSLLGDLTKVAGFEIDLRPYLGAPVIPAGVTVPVAGVQQAFFVDATIRGATGAYFCEGAVTYLVRAEGRTSTLSGAEPLWQVI